MDNGTLTAVLAFAGTLIGSLGGILAANKLVNYRLQELEKKVEKHNNVIERVYKLEETEAVQNEKISVANRRIDELEKTREVRK